LTVGTWQLYWLVVAKEAQGTGIGGQLLRHAEEGARGAGGRVLFIETSSQPHYELTRRFYLKHDYEQHAVLKDFYADGDSLIVFRKALK
jgi:GNAT superfamily N-acetyltransferase